MRSEIRIIAKIRRIQGNYSSFSIVEFWLSGASSMGLRFYAGASAIFSPWFSVFFFVTGWISVIFTSIPSVVFPIIYDWSVGSTFVLSTSGSVFSASFYIGATFASLASLNSSASFSYCILSISSLSPLFVSSSTLFFKASSASRGSWTTSTFSSSLPTLFFSILVSSACLSFSKSLSFSACFFSSMIISGPVISESGAFSACFTSSVRVSRLAFFVILTYSAFYNLSARVYNLILSEIKAYSASFASSVRSSRLVFCDILTFSACFASFLRVSSLVLSGRRTFSVFLTSSESVSELIFSESLGSLTRSAYSVRISRPTFSTILGSLSRYALSVRVSNLAFSESLGCSACYFPSMIRSRLSFFGILTYSLFFASAVICSSVTSSEILGSGACFVPSVINAWPAFSAILTSSDCLSVFVSNLAFTERLSYSTRFGSSMISSRSGFFAILTSSDSFSFFVRVSIMTFYDSLASLSCFTLSLRISTLALSEFFACSVCVVSFFSRVLIPTSLVFSFRPAYYVISLSTTSFFKVTCSTFFTITASTVRIEAVERIEEMRLRASSWLILASTSCNSLAFYATSGFLIYKPWSKCPFPYWILSFFVVSCAKSQPTCMLLCLSQINLCFASQR